MGAWPSATAIDTTDIDGSTDDPDAARVDLLSTVQDVNLMKAATATETTSGPCEVATQSETNSGTDDTRVLTPKKLRDLEVRGALVNLTSSFSIVTATHTGIQFTNEAYDTHTIHDNASNTERLTVPSGWTYVRLVAQVKLSTQSSGTLREVYMQKNASGAAVGVPSVWRDPESYTTYYNLVTPILSVVATDYFRLFVYHDNGSDMTALATETWFSMELIK